MLQLSIKAFDKLTLNFVEVALLVFGQEVGVCVFSGIYFPDKQGFEPAVLTARVAGRCEASRDTKKPS